VHSTPRWDQIHTRHGSVQPIIIERKAPKILKSLSGNLGNFQARSRARFRDWSMSIQARKSANSICEPYSEYGRCKNTEEEGSKVQEYSENVPAVFRD
jgi:hypothetical protein